MELTAVASDGITVVEGVPDEPFMSGLADVDRVVETCLSGRVELVLLYASNMTDAFFDLSSGEAGAVLQKLRQYGIRLAVVCAPGRVEFSSRFGDMVVEERRRTYFGVFDTRDEARAWLATAS